MARFTLKKHYCSLIFRQANPPLMRRKLLREALQVGLSKLRAEEEAATQETSMPAYGSQVCRQSPFIAQTQRLSNAVAITFMA
jgi:hypothetical protein